MKKILLILFLLVSFGMAEEAALKNLQDLGRGYSKDLVTNQIYYQDEPMKVVFSPKTFEIITTEDGKADAKDYYSHYSKGQHYGKMEHARGWIRIPYYPIFDTENIVPVFCFDFLDGTPSELFNCYQKYIPDDLQEEFSLLDKDSFRIIDKGHNLFLIGDKNIVLAFRNEMKGFYQTEMDPNTLEKIGTQKNPMYNPGGGDGAISTRTTYWKDKDSVFFGAGKIDKADPKSFELLTYPYSKDQSFTFSRSRVLNGIPANEGAVEVEVDHNSFEILGYSGGEFRGSYAIYLKNLNKIYYERQVSTHRTAAIEIKNADIETFEILDYPYAKDKNNVYYRGEAIKNFSSKDFKIDDKTFSIAHNNDAVIFENQTLENLSVNDFELILSQTPHAYATPEAVMLLKDKNIIYFINIYHIGRFGKNSSKITLLPLNPDSVELDGRFIIKDNKTTMIYGVAYQSNYEKPTFVITELSNLGIDLPTLKSIDDKCLKDKDGKCEIYDLLRKIRDMTLSTKTSD